MYYNNLLEEYYRVYKTIEAISQSYYFLHM